MQIGPGKATATNLNSVRGRRRTVQSGGRGGGAISTWRIEKEQL